MSRPRTGLTPPLGLALGLALALVLALALLPFPLASGGGAAVAAPTQPDRAADPVPTLVAHDLHIAYADMAVEGAVVAGRIRMFKDDLERALGPMVGADAFTLRPGGEADALVMRYLRQRLVLEVAGPNAAGASDRAGAGGADGADGADVAVLEPTLLQSGEDMLDREAVWWVIVQYEATAPIDTLRVRNTLLFDVFDDQRNIMKIVRFPDETQKTFYFDENEAEHVVTY